MAATLSPSSSTCNCHLLNPALFSGSSSISRQFINYPLQFFPKGRKFPLFKKHKFEAKIKAVNGAKAFNTTSWDEKPSEILPDGKRVYLDEQDVVTFLDPPKELIPLDPSSYNPASYLWKKISEIPEERRHRLLYLLNPRLILAAWEVAGGRYNDAKLAKMSSSNLLSGENDALSLEFWNCRKSGGPMPFGLIKYLQMAIFRKDGNIFGRLIGVSPLARMATSSSPLYFTVKEVNEVMPTDQPCDLAYEFGDGLLNLHDYPEGFPMPAKHPWPFNDQVVIYVRHLGPGVMVGQVWQEGLALEQIPKKLCGEILMVKDYTVSNGDDS
ncbi:uncharacterized protein LOC110687989 isoform X2 [Chenopodium quinoa]|uniref:uncharacterized protein LOC110687989 isoform X2 n=1 Tax=Chenopodium quinoa TaxID=63459 RepID=UPI000B77AA86|nr:uncharacterized protein LOC110687989 isoform X2 [Chenopodium quinoa]